ncbi:MAG: FAD-binding oxidoreductase, partial [Myxococcales bacterium]|nr:FAD-binding oxidoreductase [Myxococcales bacterium]
GPIVGPVQGVDNLYIAAGHEGSGLTMAPATAETILEAMSGLLRQK